jgi:AraC family transcriptional activator of mtrCDE
MDIVSQIISIAHLRGTVDLRCLLAGRATLDNPASAAGTAPFHLLLAGEVTVELPARAIDLAAGDVLVLPAGKAHRVHTTAGGRRRRVVREPGSLMTTVRTTGGAPPEVDLFCGRYIFGPGPGELLFTSMPDPLHVSFSDQSSEPMRLLSTLMRTEAERDAPGTAAILSSLCDALLAMVLRSTPGRRLASGALWTAVDDKRLRSVVDAVLQDPGRRWTIAELARLSSMSRATFIRHFKRSTGMTVGDFLIRIRMMLAADLLTSGDTTIGAIAAEVGYRSESAFGHAFRAATGSTPARFRRAASRR